jgi:NAD(P)-dependent dehydrogenase (short-subunit alcohol dehydrogenase family)
VSGTETSTYEFHLRGTSLVITGAGRGLGRAYALTVAALGANVVVNDVDVGIAEAVTAEIRASGGTAIASGHSVAEPVECQELVDGCVRSFGRIDGLVNNAGIHYVADAVDDPPERQQQLLTTNVLGSMWCGSAALRYMLAQGAGSVVNTVSGAAVGVSGMAAYSTSKAALIGLTYAWAQETAGTGVRVNAISPVAATRMSVDDTSPPAGGIAPLVAWLLHAESARVTGQVIRFDGTLLGLMTPPRLARPALRRPKWSPWTVGAAFAEDLGRRLQPFGYGVLRADADGN